MTDRHDPRVRRATRLAWTAAVVLTLASAAWQRLSGPTHPVTVDAVVGEADVHARLLRSHSITADQPVAVRAPAADVTGVLRWRRYPSSEPWREDALIRRGDELVGALPRQPAAGKLQYQVRLTRGDATVGVPDAPVVTRFKGDVSPLVLIPHVACMFLALLFSARAGAGAAVGVLFARAATVALVLWVVGGLVLGPGVQKQAFDAWWTGVPFGTDLTDNKTLIAAVAWAWAVWRSQDSGRGRAAVLAATVVTFVVFAIPHSVWGSEVDWDKVPAAGAPASD